MDKNLKKSIGNKLAVLILLVITALLLFAGNKLGFWSDPFEGLETVMGKGSDEDFDGLRIVFIDVGQGDAIFAECDGVSMLIDGGEKGNEQKLINTLRTYGIKKLNYVVSTHPHTDHIGSLAGVIDEFGAETVIMPKLPEALVPTSSIFSAFLDSVSVNADKAVYSKPGEVYSLGKASFEIVAPLSSEHDNLNDMSIVIKLVYGENSFLFAGDAGENEETEIVGSGISVDCDVLKVGHHGSSSSSSNAFLSAVTPEICVISCGADNDYGHPHKAALERLVNYTGRIYRTDIYGDILMKSDGKNIITYVNGNEVL